MGKFKYIESQEYKYKVVPEKGLVICECTVKLDWYKLPYDIWDSTKLKVLKKYNKDLDVSWPEFRLRAVARTHPNDTFDEKTGKRIAKSKVNIKLYRMLEHCVKLMADDLYKTAYLASKCKESIYELRLRELDHLKELSK